MRFPRMRSRTDGREQASRVMDYQVAWCHVASHIAVSVLCETSVCRLSWGEREVDGNMLSTVCRVSEHPLPPPIPPAWTLPLINTTTIPQSPCRPLLWTVPCSWHCTARHVFTRLITELGKLNVLASPVRPCFILFASMFSVVAC